MYKQPLFDYYRLKVISQLPTLLATILPSFIVVLSYDGFRVTDCTELFLCKIRKSAAQPTVGNRPDSSERNPIANRDVEVTDFYSRKLGKK
jgi:hypothetical protein